MYAAVLLVAATMIASEASLGSGSVLVADLAMTRMVELNAVEPWCLLYHDRGVIQRMVLGSDPRKNQGIIYPGTKWCGQGNRASSYEDLGRHAAEDACCREHDHCPMTIEPHKCINGICNTAPITRSHCDCDAKLRRCLQSINTEVANTIGIVYFNILQVTCFKERRPCSQWQRIGYAEPEWLLLCSQYKFQPSDKYVPLMPLNL